MIRLHEVSTAAVVAAALVAAMAAACPVPAAGPASRSDGDEPSGRLVELVRENGLPGESYAVLAEDGAWSRFADPQAVTFVGRSRRTFIGWVDSAGRAVVGTLDHATGELWTSVAKDGLEADDRSAPTLLVRPDGRVLVFYSGLRGRWLVYRMSAGTEDAGQWGREGAASGHTSGFWGYNYPCPAILTSEDERRYVFWVGDGHRPMFATSDRGLMDWGDALELVEGGGERPHVKVAADSASIHIAIGSGQPGVDEVSSIYYIRYSGGSFRRADGTVIAQTEELPLALESTDLVYDSISTGFPAEVWDIAVTPSGSPVIAYAAFRSDADARHRYAAWDGTSWREVEIVPAGTGSAEDGDGVSALSYMSPGLALDRADPSVVYLSRAVDGIYEIERWRTADLGETWESEPVTRGSWSDNIRPAVPAGRTADGPELIWMHGAYAGHEAFATSLRVK